MSVVDPATGETLPNDAIQRVLFVCHPVHVYAIPPRSSMKGYTAADWTAPDPQNDGKTRQIFTARLRILETAIPPQASPTTKTTSTAEQEKVKTDILLEDPATGSLFAGAPYTDESAVEHVVDSSRFFALRVVGDGGKKAVLGIGFEDRSEAFDFGVTLQEARKVLGFGGGVDTDTTTTGAASATAKSGPQPPRAPGGATATPRGPQMRTPGGRMPAPAPGNIASRPSPSPQGQQAPSTEKPEASNDYSLKPGQTIRLDIGGRRGGTSNEPKKNNNASSSTQDENAALFSIPPPPGSGGTTSRSGENMSAAFPTIPPPPSSGRGTSSDRRKTSPVPPPGESSAKSTDSGFDDDEFGDFQ